MRKKLGWISVALFIFTFAQIYLLPVNGFWGRIIFWGGLAAALVTALFSIRGAGKVIALILLSGFLIYFVYGVYVMIGF
ncbi:hypothetical protein [Exiguobacterium undae]|uniref:Uncharacterized protein n=1 Tax=Exiguobacterium undae TaxID=169177 RepID=A0ABX2VD58_9BACL|nr:hypothetical protein [Exiguobacterium undae]OAN15704.1 hypothetical protein A3783_07155 [Exiguobacterium undae]